MVGWLMLILFIILVIIVWISLLNNAKQSKINFQVEEDAMEQVSSAAPQKRVSELELDPGPPADSGDNPHKDDLTVIEGIGPKVNSLLNQAGILSFKQLGETEVAQLKDILASRKYPYMDPGTWPMQAKLAAEGKFEDLEIYQRQLRAGRN